MEWIERALKRPWLSPRCSTEVQAPCELMRVCCVCCRACGSEIESKTRASVAIQGDKLVGNACESSTPGQHDRSLSGC